MPRKKVTTSLAPTEEPKDKLAKFRVTADTASVRYAGQVWRVRRQTPTLLAISRGSGDREEFLWVHRDVVSEVPPPKPKKSRKARKTSKAPKTPKATKVAKATKEKTPKKVVARKKVAKTPTKKRGSVRKRK